jgi:hypothetical protein
MKTNLPKSNFIKILILFLFLSSPVVQAQFGIDTSRIISPGWQPQQQKHTLPFALLPSPVLNGLKAGHKPRSFTPDTSSISANAYIQNRYNRQFNRRNPFALPPAYLGTKSVTYRAQQQPEAVPRLCQSLGIV